MQFAQNVKYEPGHPEDQQAFVDARAPLNRDGDELVDDSLEDWSRSSSVVTCRQRPDPAVARNC